MSGRAMLLFGVGDNVRVLSEALVVAEPEMFDIISPLTVGMAESGRSGVDIKRVMHSINISPVAWMRGRVADTMAAGRVALVEVGTAGDLDRWHAITGEDGIQVIRWGQGWDTSRDESSRVMEFEDTRCGGLFSHRAVCIGGEGANSTACTVRRIVRSRAESLERSAGYPKLYGKPKKAQPGSGEAMDRALAAVRWDLLMLAQEAAVEQLCL